MKISRVRIAFRGVERRGRVETLTPSTTPGGSLDEDQLGGSTRGTDAGDTSLVEVEGIGCADTIGFIVDIEDDVGIRFELGSKVLPPGGEGSVVGDHSAIIASKIVRIEDGISSLSGDVGGNLKRKGKYSALEYITLVDVRP